MAEEIPKPRRTKGTVAYRTRNHFALGVIAVGVLFGVLFHFSSPAQILSKAIREGKKFAPTEEELERRELMSLVLRKRGEEIEKMMEEKKEGRPF